MALSDAGGVVIAAAIAAVPASIAAFNSVRTRKSVRTPNGTTLGENSEAAAMGVADLHRRMDRFEAHVLDEQVHRR